MPPTPTPRRALLLLPPPPAPPSYAALKAAYHAPLLLVLQELATLPDRTQHRVVLDIALPCPHLHAHLDAPRGPLYDTTQSLVAALYKLVCVIAATQAIATEDAEGVDVRVLLLAHPRHAQPEPPHTDVESTPERDTLGPVISLHTLARSPRSWNTVYSVHSEQGENLLKSFLSLSGSANIANAAWNLKKVRGGIVTVQDTTPPAAASSETAKAPVKHQSVAVGGTFDHMHIGHKLLLTMFAFVLARSPPDEAHTASVLTIGITGDELLKKKKYAEYLESWHDRQQAVHDFLGSILYFGPSDDQRIRVDEVNDPGPNGHAVHVSYPSGLLIKYVEIWDPFGPTITDESISALVISLETRSGGAAVNGKRTEQGWKELEVFEVAVLDAGEEESVDETFQSKLSSTEIRRLRSERST